jgi:hypothetical protein
MTPCGRLEDRRRLGRAGGAARHLRAHNDYSVMIRPAMVTTMMNNHHYLGHERFDDRRTGRGK